MIAGIPVINGMTGSAQSEFKVRHSLGEALEKVTAFRPTVLWGVPSFVRRFLDEAKRQGRDLSAARLVITSGEPVPPALRAEMKALLAACGAGDVQFRARYAFTEMQGGLVQCAEDAPGQNVTPDLYHLEVVDPETGRRLPDGESGMLAITHLHRRGTVLLRYLVGDIVTLSREPCPHCGRIGERVVRTPRRTGSLVKCRGMLVNTDVVIDVLSAVEAIGVFQIVFMRDDAPGAMDRMVIRIERDADDAALRERLIARRAAGGVAAAGGGVHGARGALRPGAVDQGAAGGRSAAEGGLNWSQLPGVDFVSAGPINVLVLFFRRSPSIAVSGERAECDARQLASRWSAGRRRAPQGPRAPGPPPPSKPMGPGTWRGPAFAKPVRELRKAPGASRRSNPSFEGKEKRVPAEAGTG